MDERYVLQFAERLRELGFPELLAEQMDRFTEEPGVLLPLSHRAVHDQNVVNYTVFAFRKPHDWRFEYEIARIDVSLRRPFDLENVVIHGIDVRDLDRRMAAEDWTDEAKFTERHRQMLKELWKLSENRHPTGIEVREKLVLKHLSDIEFGQQLPQIEAIRARHEIQRSFNAPGQVTFSAIQMYNLLDGRPVAVIIPDEFGAGVTKWIGADTSVREMSGGPVLTVYERSDEFDVRAALLRTRYAEFLSDKEIVDAVESFKAGNSTWVGASMVGRDDDVLLLAEPWNNRVKEDYHKMKAFGLLTEESIEDRIAHQTADKEELIANLEKSLIAQGFGGVDRQELRSAIFFGDREFELKCNLLFGSDGLRCRIDIEYRDGLEEYEVRSVHASLRKGFVLPSETPNGTDVEEIENRLTEVNWEQGDFLDPKGRRLRRLDAVERAVQVKVDELLEYLSRESYLLPDGLTLKEKLLYKYWIDTPNEKYIPDLGRVSRALSIDGKFDQFTFMHVNAEEIYRLLNGYAVSRNFGGEGEDTLHRGYLVMHENGNNRFVQWLPGPAGYELENQLDARVPGFRSLLDRSEVVKDLFDGKEVLFADVAGGNREYSLRLAKEDWRVLLSVFFKSDRLKVDEVNINLGKMAGHLREMGFGESANIVFRMFDNHKERFSVERNLELVDRTNIKANLQLSRSGDAYFISSVEIAIIKEINIPLVRNVDTDDLEGEMRMVDWSKADYYQYGNDLFDVTAAGDLTSYMEVGNTLTKLKALYDSESTVDKWNAEALISKYLLFTPTETFSFDKNPFENRFLLEYTFTGALIDRLNIQELINLVDGRSVFSGSYGEEGEEWYKIDFGELPPLLNLVSSEGFGRLLRELELLKADGFDIEEARTSLRHGNVVEVGVSFENKTLRMPVFIDVSREKFVVGGFGVTEDLRRFLQEHPNWEHRPTRREIGQVRDFSIHPAPVDERVMRNILGQMEAWGFDRAGEAEARTALQVGYPKFTIGYQKDVGEEIITAAISFGPTLLMDGVLLGYDFSLKKPDGQTISFEVGAGDLPLMTMHSAKNLANGRPVHLPEDSLTGHWYLMESYSNSLGGDTKWRKIAFQALELVEQIDKMPIKNVREHSTRSRIFSALMRGDLAPVTLVRDGKEAPGFLSFDLRDRKVKMSLNDGTRGAGEAHHPGEGEGRGNGRGLR